MPDSVCWSPWLGREWCERAYGGAGPIHPGFFHYYSTTNLLDVALRLGVLWYRTDIIQYDDNGLMRQQAAASRAASVYQGPRRKGAQDRAFYLAYQG